LSAPLTIIILTDSADLSPLLSQYLSTQRYVLQYFDKPAEFLAWIEAGKHELDCLIFYTRTQLLPVINHLYDRGLILPLVMIQGSMLDAKADGSVLNTDVATTDRSIDSRLAPKSYIYQPSEVILAIADLAEIGVAIDEAITKFLNLTPVTPTPEDAQFTEIKIPVAKPNFMLQQQQRLAEKLKERLGYLAVYYKRNPRQFFRHLDRQQKEDLLHQLKFQYRHIVLAYFSESSATNDTIDEFVSSTFFSDLSVSEIVKIHMELMEEFAQQLKLEGRSEEILLDYRLTLIDIIAHLCEMYRRSVPREM
jgi:circadian clock protein KaiA